MDQSQLASIFGMSTDALGLKTQYDIIMGCVETGNGASAISTVNVGLVPYKLWRVVGMGFIVTTKGASTVAEKVEFGQLTASADTDAFGTCAQDTTADDELEVGDMYFKSADQGVSLVDFPAWANAGTPTFAEGGAQLGVWQTTPQMLTISKTNVASSTATVVGFYVVEVA